MPRLSRRVELHDFLYALQDEVSVMLVAVRDFWLREAEESNTVTLDLPGSPSKLSMMPQDVLEPKRLRLVMDAGHLKVGRLRLAGELEVVWDRTLAPELTARLRDAELATLDGTLDRGDNHRGDRPTDQNSATREANDGQEEQAER